MLYSICHSKWVQVVRCCRSQGCGEWRALLWAAAASRVGPTCEHEGLGSLWKCERFSGKEEQGSELCRAPDLRSLCEQQGPDLLLMSQRSYPLQRQTNSSSGSASFAFWLPLAEVGAESFRASLYPCLVLTRLWGRTSQPAWLSTALGWVPAVSPPRLSWQLPICRALGNSSRAPAAAGPVTACRPAGPCAPAALKAARQRSTGSSWWLFALYTY